MPNLCESAELFLLFVSSAFLSGEIACVRSPDPCHPCNPRFLFPPVIGVIRG
jgi:hypothetical protein